MTMYKSQIEAVLGLDAQSRRTFKGVFAIDKLPTKCEKDSSYVINYDEHDEVGSHWIAVYKDKKGNTDLFDSAGHPPLDERLSDFIGQTFSYNPYQLQLDLSNACGFYSVYFIIQRSRNVHASEILNVLCRSNSDFLVKSYLYARYKPIFT